MAPGRTVLILLLFAAVALAATPPSQLNYQGMLRDSNNQPVNGSIDMTFRFYDTDVGGTLLLTDAHTGAIAVPVTAGFFTVALGGGTVTPGSESTMDAVFQNHGAVYMEVQIALETLSPRTHLASTAYSMNSSAVDGNVIGSAFGNIPLNNGIPNVRLNADLLDSLNSISFALSPHSHAASDIASDALSAAYGGTGADTSGTVAGSLLRAAGGGWAPLAPGGNGDILTTSGGLAVWQSWPGGLGGAGSSGKLTRFNASNTVADSIIDELNGGIGIGRPAPPAGLTMDVAGLGKFLDGNTSSRAFAASGTYGLDGSGSSMGGRFHTLTHSGIANVGYGDEGIEAYGDSAGGLFHNPSGTGHAVFATGDGGLYAIGNGYGAAFGDNDNSGYAYLGYGNTGIEAAGNQSGGHFASTDNLSSMYLGSGDLGINGLGSQAGGAFSSSNNTAACFVGSGDLGVYAYGTTAGGYFQDLDNSGYAYPGYGDRGIEGYGNDAGGYFMDLNDFGQAWAAYGGYGIVGSGSSKGGSFGGPQFSVADLAGFGFDGNSGIEAWGVGAGGGFHDLNGSAFAFPGDDTNKILGNGSVSFVQNHPTEKDRVIVYSTPEGDEVATYTRGAAKLHNGVARIALGATFAWVTNPDIGLTGWVTPRENCNGLYIESLTPSEMVVRESEGGSSNATFDFMVYGLRIGFEEAGVVRNKEMEAWIPSMAKHRERYRQHPEWKAFNAMERFESMRTAAGMAAPLDLTASHALLAAVHEFDPAMDKGPSPPKSATETATASASNDVIVAKSFRASDAELARQMRIRDVVEAGDLVVMDSTGRIRKADTAQDPNVIGIVADQPGVVLANQTAAKQRSPIALSGIALCKVDAQFGVIRAGDLLTASSTPGHAMRAENPASRGIIGKALESWDTGTGRIRILIFHREEELR